MNRTHKTLHGADDFTGVLSGTSLLMVDAVAGAISGAGALIGDLARLAARWQTRLEQRRHLAALDDRLLRDIGFDRAKAEAEADKAFWQR